MADPKKMSVEEILAAARAQRAGSAAAPKAESAPEPSAPEAQAETTSEAEAPSSAKSAVPGKSPKEMSVAEMLAAARARKPADAAGAAKPAAETPAVSTASAAGKSAKSMSVAEMLAAARGEKSAAKPAAEKPAEAKAVPKEKPVAAEKASPKPASKPAEKSPSAAGPKDTASILAAARAGKPKPGPMTKAEAAAKGEAKPKPAKEKLEVPPLPEKPAYARAVAPAASDDGEDRRGFFGALAGVVVGSSLAVGFSSLAVTHLLWLLGFARFMFPNILTEPPTRFKVGFPDEYAPGQVEEKFKAQFGVWIVRYEYEGVPMMYALQSVCTHLGCTPNWLEGEQKFKCPCHGSGFYKDGINFEGPAPRPLERFVLRLSDDGQLEVDKSRKFLQEKGEWKDPSSYVTV